MSNSAIPPNVNGIRGLHSKEEARQYPGERKGSAQSDCQTDRRQSYSLPEDQLQDRGSLRPERNANADLIRALVD